MLVMCGTLIVALTLVALVYTPLARVVSIPNPELEQRYGQEIQQTQTRLEQLNRDVLRLKAYNLQLRRALGDQSARDTSALAVLLPSDAVRERGSAGGVRSGKTFDVPGPIVQESSEDVDLHVLRSAVMTVGGTNVRLPFPLLPPTEGFVSQRFDASRKHFGIDYAGKQGAPIFAAADGYVLFSGWTYEDGNMLIVSHGGSYVTVYKHNQALFKSAHSIVKRGEVIALIGTSGNTSLGPHLHFEVWRDGIPRDPEQYVLNVHKSQ